MSNMINVLEPAPVSAWLRYYRDNLDTRGMRSVTVSIHSDANDFVGTTAYNASDRFFCTRGNSVEEAFAKLRSQIDIDPVLQLRNDAKALLRQAKELEDAREG